MTKAQQITDVLTHHGEGCGWHPGEQAVKFVDMLAGDVLTLRPDGGADRLHVGAVAAAWRARVSGGMVVATERGFALVDTNGAVEWSTQAWTDTSVRMNEGACDPLGRFYCGSMAYDARPGAGTLWRLDADRSVQAVADGFTTPNGMVWSLGGTLAYHIDTPTGRIDCYDFDPELGLVDRRPVVEVTGGDPDGMTIDADGNLWVALWGGGAVHCYAPGGELLHVVEVDARQVSSCAFGGPDLDRLHITTSREGLGEGDDPKAGALFAAEVGVRGVPLRPFGG
ncbi:SMP-30/gluconolactonase/LRE family protein [Labedaea rhizosphaerae]|uniref:Sugar lactone lactonase YvrE n=1 Tax=Labedaea rhizosphaerae TaxID=598644 RepID=A0A4R6SGS8_LABRH|nr:SMP-30/gluconolactonase/LRE family protein [Labedaea rhizosphaerae]TDQ00720.1 sugar lactone lactonase YvrE [Labedaea rhizosphaerae]